jgi:hypothetical protein
MPAIPKPLDEITVADLQRLIDERAVEDELLEFKGALPSGGGKQDRWYEVPTEVGNHAKLDMLAAIVAMANSYGGDVVLGLTESGVPLHQAQSISPIPRCRDLAQRLAMFARNLVSPQVALLKIAPIPTDGEAGVIVIRVPRSPLAPHRVEVPGTAKECYKRVRDRSEPMSMREIQDLTLDTARGVERVNQRMIELRERYYGMGNLGAWRRVALGYVSYCVRAVPTTPVAVAQLHGVSELVPNSAMATVKFSDGRKFPMITDSPPTTYRPMLRGTQLIYTRDRTTHITEFANDGAYLRCHATKAEQEKTAQSYLHVEWIFTAVINACVTIDQFRRYAGAEAVEFALEVEIAIYRDQCAIAGFGATKLAPNALLISSGINFPRYSVGPVEERANLLTRFHRDFWDALGLDAQKDTIEEVRMGAWIGG